MSIHHQIVSGLLCCQNLRGTHWCQSEDHQWAPKAQRLSRIPSTGQEASLRNSGLPLRCNAAPSKTTTHQQNRATKEREGGSSGEGGDDATGHQNNDKMKPSATLSTEQVSHIRRGRRRKTGRGNRELAEGENKFK